MQHGVRQHIRHEKIYILYFNKFYKYSFLEIIIFKKLNIKMYVYLQQLWNN